MYEYSAKLVRVIDGDTAVLDIDLGFQVTKRDTFRLRGINTPELHASDPLLRQTAQEARRKLESLIADRFILARTFKDQQDKYGRMLVEMFVTIVSFDDSQDKHVAQEVNVNAELVRLGLAKPYMV